MTDATLAFMMIGVLELLIILFLLAPLLLVGIGAAAWLIVRRSSLKAENTRLRTQLQNQTTVRTSTPDEQQTR